MKKHMLLYCLLFANLACATTHVSLTRLSETTYDTEITIPLQDGDFVYQEYLNLTTNHPHVTIENISIAQETVDHFDASFKETKKAYAHPVTMKCTLTTAPKVSLDDVKLQVRYYIASQKQLAQESISLQPSPTTHTPTTPEIATIIDVDSAESIQQDPAHEQEEPQTKDSWAVRLSNVLKNTESRFLQLLIIFLLGLLMSLTPCIYPMIPITAGILQAQHSKSILTNFSVALAYTLGMATTFASLGLLAAFAGHALGGFMTKAWFILPVVAMLAYLAFSLLGWYEMYTPKFMRPKSHKVSGGSYISAFIFGVISGSVASPCLSPGLVLLLSIVAALQNLFLGFIMLFVFGLGLGLPLLIIGTFSSSLSVLPRAGMWMVEIKKIFGLIMLAMCLYFLGYLLPAGILMWLITIFVLLTGIMYLYSAQRSHSKSGRLFKNILGMLLIASSVVLIFKSYRELYMQCPVAEGPWYSEYACAKQKAIFEKKLLLLDIGTPVCSICKAIDATLFKNEEVLETIARLFVPVKLDGAQEENKEILTHFNVIGFPTILLLNPNTDTIIKQWGPELYGTKPEKFIAELEQL